MTATIPKTLCTIFICIWAASIAVAQQDSSPAPQTGTIIGTVLDIEGGIIPAASIVLQGPAPEDKRRFMSQENGFFQFQAVKPAITYHVSVSAQGFANWTSNEVTLQPGQYFILTGIKLQVATVEVTVNAVDIEEVAIEQVKVAETQRIGGVVPNFYVVYDRNPVRLSTKLKFQLALKMLADPITVTGFGLDAAIYQAADYPSYRQGAKGYGERLASVFAGSYTNVLVGNALLPSLLHQDPRYFYQGTGTVRSRLLHALSNPFVIRGDDGHWHPNYSNIGGDIASGAVANAYYPPADRGVSLLLGNALIGAGGRMLNGVVQEFVLRRLTSGRIARTR